MDLITIPISLCPLLPGATLLQLLYYVTAVPLVHVECQVVPPSNQHYKRYNVAPAAVCLQAVVCSAVQVISLMLLWLQEVWL
jgi:hypothetical protein